MAVLSLVGLFPRCQCSSTLLVVVCALSLVLVQICSGSAILRRQQVYGALGAALDKRAPHDGNPCPDAEKPFPCKSTATCIPMGYLCDSNIDCEDGYDENEELCAAANRPPVVDIKNFLQSEKKWIMNHLFAGRDIDLVAHGLAVSNKVNDFRQRLGMTSAEVAPLYAALKATEEGDTNEMVQLGMPPSSWNDVSFIFSKLVKSGFTK